jgi:putative peptidoglycan lipid II flippase
LRSTAQVLDRPPAEGSGRLLTATVVADAAAGVETAGHAPSAGLGMAAVVAVAGLLGTLSGFGREMAIASRFGAGSETDAYLTAVLLPTVLLQLVSSGVMSAYLVPYLSEMLEKGDERGAWRIVGTTGLMTLALLVVAAVLTALASGPMVSLIAPGFGPATRALAIDLARLLSVLFVFLGMTGFLAGVLYAFQRFTAASLAAFVFNIVIIAGALFLGAPLGIWGLAGATLLAGACQVGLVVWALRDLPGRRFLGLELHSAYLRRLGAALAPVLLLAVISQGYMAAERVIASHLAEGSVTALNYGFRIAMFPMVFCSSLTIVSFPLLSRQAARGDEGSFCATVSTSARLMLAAAAPITVLLFFLAGPAVRFLLERGAFDAADAARTAAALRFYGLGLVAYGLTWQFTVSLYALGDYKSPLLVHLLVVGPRIAASAALAWVAAEAGLAAGLSLSAAVLMCALGLALSRRMKAFHLRSLAPTAYRVGVAGLLMALTLLLATRLLSSWEGGGMLATGAYLASTAAAGLAVYVAVVLALRLEEMNLLKRRLRLALASLRSTASLPRPTTEA